MDMSDEDLLAIRGGEIRTLAIVVKDENDGWALAAITNLERPALGIRWFEEGVGFPVGMYGRPLWFVIPEALAEPIVKSLPLDPSFKLRVRQFLRGLLSGEELKALT